MFVSTSEQDEKQTEPNELKSDIRVSPIGSDWSVSNFWIGCYEIW